jgi:hypothetical protein
MVNGWWNGWWVQRGIRSPMACHIECTDSKLRGWGVDTLGFFTMNGAASPQGRRIAWTKDQLSLHSVRYAGASSVPRLMHGQWRTPDGNQDAWQLGWSPERELSRSAAQCVIRGLAALQIGDHLLACRLLVDASRTERISQVSLVAALLSKHVGEASVAEEQFESARDLAKRAGSYHLLEIISRYRPL